MACLKKVNGLFALIDNYDSFTYNLLHYMAELGAEVKVFRNDEISVAELAKMTPEGIVLSPGPKTPDFAGICLQLVEELSGDIPILGVCLGHQAIGQVYGAKVVRAHELMHGKTSEIEHNGSGIFDGIPSPFTATRYHSLTLEPETIPKILKITAKTEDGVIMGLQHESLPLYGVQFHPESILSQHGHKLLQNFIRLANRQ